jgi:beta-phosphoglucomutase
MDGVLADTEPLQARAWVVLLERYGIRQDPGDYDRWIGIANIETARAVAASFELPVSPAALIAQREPVYLDLVSRELVPFPGLEECLAGLAGVPMALATSAGRAEVDRVLGVLGFARFFRALVTGDDVARPKPDPEPYLRAAAALGIPPEACAVVEDSAAGVASARDAGCHVRAVTTTHPPEALRGAHAVHASTVEALRDLRRLLGAAAPP